MVLTPTEAARIAENIERVFDEVHSLYDFSKYPAADYARFASSFASHDPNAPISEALRWKWGHWKKENFPQVQKALIEEITTSWPAFTSSNSRLDSESTFRWWQNRLHRPTTYITVAFITHLVHHAEFLPIIDQHNFRAMNSLLNQVRASHQLKKKPSSWADIENLRTFMKILEHHTGRNLSELDRFLMMYGKHRAER